MKNYDRTLKALITQQVLVEAAMVILGLGLIAIVCSIVSDHAFWR